MVRNRTICACVRYCTLFGKHNLPAHSKSHLLPFTQLSISYHIIYYTRYHIQYNYIDITILLSYCNYIVTIIISIIYSYIYRYNLSIKIYDNQYRYKYTDSIIRMILNNTEVNKYTVYSLHNMQ